MADSDAWEIWVGADGSIFEHVHSREVCAGHACCLHAPSDHRMRDWQLHWRNDRGLMERLCPHGIGHPDPDDLAHGESVMPGSAAGRGIHGCDGCCTPEGWMGEA